MPDFNAILAALANLPSPLNPGSVPMVPAPAPPISGGPAFPQAEQDIAAQSVAPTAPTEPLDQNLIRQIMALAPPAPTPPPKPTTAQKIFNAIGGFGAGYLGNGPQYLAQLQEPQREYQRQLQNYNNERSRFGLTALEAAQSKQERAQAERQRRADIQAQRDFEVKLDQMKFTNETARDQARQAFQLELQARNLREAEQKQKDIEERQVRIQIGRAAQKYRDAGAKGTIPNELANRDFNPDAPVSPAADKWYSINVIAKQAQAAYLEARKAKALAGGGSGKPGRPVAVLEDGSQVPISKVDTKNGRAVINGKPVKVVGYTGGGAAGAQTPKPQGPPADPLGIR